MVSIINTGGSGTANISIHDLYLSSLPLVDQVIDVIGDGEIYSVYISGGTVADIGIRVSLGPWRIHDNRIRAGDTGIHLIAGATRNIISNNYLGAGFVGDGILIEGDDNIIIGNFVDGGTIRITGDNNHIIGNFFRSLDSADNGFIIAGDRNFIDGNRIVDLFGTPPTVGIQILSGATGNIIGTNELDAATTPITDAGTGTQYRNHKALAPPFIAGAATTATGVARLRLPEDVFIIDAAAMVDTAPTGAALIVDVHLNGTTIYTTQSNRPTIAAAAFDSGLATPDVQIAAAGDYLTVDVDQVGSTIAGSDLTVVIRYVPVGAIG
jgi:hypothetical protein